MRPDRLPNALAAFVGAVFDAQFVEPGEPDLGAAALRTGAHRTPILLTSAPGYDSGSQVSALAAKLQKPCAALAIGSPEGFALAEKAVNAAAQTGSWVLLKNIHLAPAWLVTLEKRLHSLNPHANFRLFLTSEIHPRLPSSLLRQALVFVREAPPGIKASLQSSFARAGARMEKAPVERARLYFLLSWFHAIVQERLRYAPLGWTKKFEFGEADLSGAMATLDEWLETKAKGRNNIAPNEIPWEALRSLFGQSIYGGRIDNEFDQRLLDGLLGKLFAPKAFDAEFSLVQAGPLSVKAPDATKRVDFERWIDALPAVQSPEWLGLPADAERLLLTNHGRKVLQNLLKMFRVDDVGEGENANAKKDEEADARPAWMKTLRVTSTQWLDRLPSAPAVPVSADEQDPLHRYFVREVASATDLLNELKSEFSLLVDVCDGKQKQTNHLRMLISSLTKGVVPKHWARYSVPPTMSVHRFLSDFLERLSQFNQLKDLKLYGNPSWQVRVGSLFAPAAFITASRQAAAKALGASLERLQLKASVVEGDVAQASGDNNRASFVVNGLSIVSAAWNNKRLEATGGMINRMPPLRFTFFAADDNAPPDHSGECALPLYLDETRSVFLLQVHLPADPTVNFVERGCALIAAHYD